MTQETGNGEGRRNGWADPKIWITAAVVAGSGLAAWGATLKTVDDHGRRLDRLEDLVAQIADLRAQVRFLVNAEERRQTREGR